MTASSFGYSFKPSWRFINWKHKVAVPWLIQLNSTLNKPVLWNFVAYNCSALCWYHYGCNNWNVRLSSLMASKRKIDTERSPDKTELILTKPLNSWDKCGKKCLSKGESIQCDLCGTWAHANLWGFLNITRDQYKAI